ncbi:MAG TPA: hypothetical protein VF989_17325, partial [Polyangiaceae bacterium]
MSQGKREKSTRRRQPKRKGSTESGGSAGGGPARGPLQGKATRTLTIDIGGTGIKVLLLDAHGKPISERARELTPKPSTPAALLRVLEKMIEQHRPF